MSKDERLRRFFTQVKEPDEWESEYARTIAFVERHGIIVTEDYLHLKLMNQAKQFAQFRKEEFIQLGKIMGCIK